MSIVLDKVAHEIDIDVFAPHTAAVMAPVDASEDDDILLDEELSADDLAEIERLKAEWEAQELRRVDSQLAEHRAFIRENWLASGMDIVDYAKTHGDTPEEVEKIRIACGFKSETWDDQRNVTRREKSKARRVSITSKAATKAAVKDIEKRNAARTSTPAKVTPAKPQSAPAVSTGADLETWARSYVAGLIDKCPAKAKKLEKSLEWQLSQLGTVPAELWQQRAQMAFDAKVRTA